MNGAFYVGATGLQAQQRGLDVVANNVANVNTTGFKRSEVRFSEMVMTNSVRDDAAPVVTTAPDALSGVQAEQTVRVFAQGDLKQTGKPFDLAISGDGFLEVLGPNGQTWLWRGGSFKVNAEGFLETDGGLILKSLIEVPDNTTEIRIERDGRVLTISNDVNAPDELGKLDLAIPDDVSRLEAMGSGYFHAVDEADVRLIEPGQDGQGVLVQGSLEASNVELTNEMVTLLLMQRAYAANAQVVQAGDQLMGIANGLKR
jgi:flagellar basal-body rod protein FlgG